MHDKVSVHSICFAGAKLDVLAQSWRAVQPKRVSFVSTQLPESDLNAVCGMLLEGGYAVETVTHVFCATLARDEAGWAEPRAGLSQAIKAARRVGARSIYMLTGGRGALDWEEAADAFSHAVAPCLAEAQAAGIPLLVENASPLLAQTHIGTTLRDTITLAEMAGIGVCIDIFGCWTEGGLAGFIERAAPRLGLVQVSDYVLTDRALPARAVPGDGAIPLERIIGRILESGYKGVFDLELLGPRIDGEGHVQAARRAASVTGEMLQRLGA